MKAGVGAHETFLRVTKQPSPREYAMFLFAVAHGARAQEIANLRITDINFTNEQIHVARLLTLAVLVWPVCEFGHVAGVSWGACLQ
jgi:integrase